MKLGKKHATNHEFWGSWNIRDDMVGSNLQTKRVSLGHLWVCKWRKVSWHYHEDSAREFRYARKYWISTFLENNKEVCSWNQGFSQMFTNTIFFLVMLFPRTSWKEGWAWDHKDGHPYPPWNQQQPPRNVGGWNTIYFLLGRPMFRGEVLLVGRVILAVISRYLERRSCW